MAVCNQIDFSWMETTSKEYPGYKDYLMEQKERNLELYLFGFGGFGQAAADSLLDHNVDITYFVDNDEKKSGKQYRGIKCISFQHFLEKKDKVFLIVAVGNPLPIIEQLDRYGIKNYNVMISPYKLVFDDTLKNMEISDVSLKLKTVSSLLEDSRSLNVLQNIIESWYKVSYNKDLFSEIYEGNQYFCKDIIPLDENSVFVDCGAFIGDSLESFLVNVSDSNFSKAFLFELNDFTCEELQSNIKQWCSPDVQRKIKVINKGVSDENAEFSYSLSESSSCIQGEGTQKAQVVRLDDELADERISLVKMDIEGSEAAAIKGGEKLIKQYKPALAICVYHQMSDIWELPLLIKSFVPEYKLYLRHHSKTQIETVLYAVCE